MELAIGAANPKLVCLLEVVKQKCLQVVRFALTHLASTDLALAELVFVRLDLVENSATRPSIVPEMSQINQRPSINAVFAEEMEKLALVVTENCTEPSTITAEFAEEMELLASILARILPIALLALKTTLVDFARKPKLAFSRVLPTENALILLLQIVYLFLNLF